MRPVAKEVVWLIFWTPEGKGCDDGIFEMARLTVPCLHAVYAIYGSPSLSGHAHGSFDANSLIDFYTGAISVHEGSWSAFDRLDLTIYVVPTWSCVPWDALEPRGNGKTSTEIYADGIDARPRV
ncbi:uncharacterized protein GIQ15_03117 [Arthroderma uncinatum]|uniref:uncharacterized protein n=1 Tax=Arthroderma uncinatum TaxID=74035 RepID=UPI00144A6002|nr:uncharacterized protein GIQ15_03117 [Arthroderma uncinatum]KAF3483793.1 hypothetical protein GIQ15_03117 [Arthroderma uncinatum]